MPEDPEVEAVLAERLGAVGAGYGGFSGAGARWSAKRLRTETAADQVDVPPASVSAVLDRLRELLQAPFDVGDDGLCRVRGTLGSGFGGLNPAYVVVVVEYLTGHVAVAAYAKEGLIKQHTAEKAVRRVLDEVGGA